MTQARGWAQCMATIVQTEALQRTAHNTAEYTDNTGRKAPQPHGYTMYIITYYTANVLQNNIKHVRDRSIKRRQIAQVEASRQSYLGRRAHTVRSPLEKHHRNSRLQALQPPQRSRPGEQPRPASQWFPVGSIWRPPPISTALRCAGALPPLHLRALQYCPLLCRGIFRKSLASRLKFDAGELSVDDPELARVCCAAFHAPSHL